MSEMARFRRTTSGSILIRILFADPIKLRCILKTGLLVLRDPLLLLPRRVKSGAVLV